MDHVIFAQCHIFLISITIRGTSSHRSGQHSAVSVYEAQRSLWVDLLRSKSQPVSSETARPLGGNLNPQAWAPKPSLAIRCRPLAY